MRWPAQETVALLIDQLFVNFIFCCRKSRVRIIFSCFAFIIQIISTKVYPQALEVLNFL